MGKKRGTFRLSGVGTKVEQHAERVLRMLKLDSQEAMGHAYASLLFLERKEPERFKMLMAETAVAVLYERFETRKKKYKPAILGVEAQPRQPKRGEVSAERRRRRLALNGEGTLSEQHIDRIKRLWSVLLEGNHNMYQYKTRVAFAESMRWLEENKPNTFLKLLESLEDMSNGDDAYFIFIRHELNQIQKQVAASHEKLDLNLLAPARSTLKERVLVHELHQKAEANLGKTTIADQEVESPNDGTAATEEIHPDQTATFDLSEGKI